MNAPRTLALAGLVALALPLVARPAAAQSVEAPEEGLYAGQAMPPHTHLEHRVNRLFVASGVIAFAAGYVPWAIQGAVLYANPPADGTNWDKAFIWRTIPLVGPYIALADYNSRQTNDCNREAPLFYMLSPSNPEVQSQTVCTDVNAGVAGQSRMYVPHLAGGGDFVWATTLVGLQIYGIVAVIYGLVGDRYVVRDAPAAHADRRMQWTIVPGAGATPMGLTFSAITF